MSLNPSLIIIASTHSAQDPSNGSSVHGFGLGLEQRSTMNIDPK
ncbi:predicted protein [Botrytis cinerea T4]|uniref:Uncharacterized protein n=1 Tax=Botryotinia fuckeliana (strain T4) TaxID=999810 RepID=G2YSU4_BOTF4|nr:predicted protein [Botrytis cinerea T4]